MQQWRLCSKIWLEIEGQPVIGQGRMVMLQAIHQHQSIIQASRETGIAYRRIRGAIRDMEAVVGKPLVVARRGGRYGGRAELTPAAISLLDAFKEISEGFQDESDARMKNGVQIL